jgi:hypothetical protein
MVPRVLRPLILSRLRFAHWTLSIWQPSSSSALKELVQFASHDERMLGAARLLGIPEWNGNE